MNVKQLLHYDPMEVENIFRSTLVHWLFTKLWFVKQGPMS